MPLEQMNDSALGGSAANGPKYAACVAIPARDEEERLPSCLEALADQTTGERFAVVVLANNCTDRTARLTRAFARSAPMRVIVKEMTLEGDQASAGGARRLAMDAALELLGPDGALMTTDADSRVNKSWIASNLAELRAGADVVCGQVTPDFMEPVAFPSRVYTQGAMEYFAQRMAAELQCLLDPLPHDPSPRHLVESGASLAVRAAIYSAVGGTPAVRYGEDRAFVERVRRAGGRIRHSTGPKVYTSCRVDGRASGGWADDLARRARDPEAVCHDVLEPTEDLVRRATLRASLRGLWPVITPADWTASLGLGEERLAELLAASATFEDAWARFEAESPLLVRRRIPGRKLLAEMNKLKKVLTRAKAESPDRKRFEDLAGEFAEKLWRGLGGEDGYSSSRPRKRRQMSASNSDR